MLLCRQLSCTLHELAGGEAGAHRVIELAGAGQRELVEAVALVELDLQEVRAQWGDAIIAGASTLRQPG